MSYRFHHLRMHSRDVDACEEAYSSVFECQIVERIEDTLGTRVAVLDPGTDVVLELHRDDDARGGDPGVIEAIGLTGSVREPNSLLTPDGLRIDLVGTRIQSDESRRPDQPHLHHVSCLVANLDEAERFYSSSFGFRPIFDFSKRREGGFRLLADCDWNDSRHDFTLELVGGPEFGPEQPWWDAHGPHFDHLCFSCADVETVYARGLASGLAPMSPPRDYPEYELTIAWLYDPDGLHVELMSPLDTEALMHAFATRDVPNDWTDDWLREITWLPPPARPPAEPDGTVGRL